MESVVPVQASVNDGPFLSADLEVGSDVQMVRAEHAAKPDPGWEHVDSHGHFHAFAGDGKTPTLTEFSEHIDCDGSCGGVCEGEGYDERRWKCSICGDPVEPAFIPDLEARTTGIPIVTRRWTRILIHGGGPLPGTAPGGSYEPATKVTVRVRSSGTELVGIGYMGQVTATYARGETHWQLRVETGELLPRPMITAAT